MKRSLLAISVVLLLTFGAAGVFASRLLHPEPPPEEVLTLENAMALPELVAIAYADVAHAAMIERTFIRVVDEEALATGDSAIAQLWRDDLAPNEMIDHWVGAVVVGETNGVVSAVTGDFPVSEIRAALASEYEIEERDSLWLLTREDVETCEVTGPIAVDLRPTRGIFGHPELVRLVAQRLDEGAAAETDLSTWRALREGQTASLALLRPERMAEGVENPIAQMAASRASEGLVGLEAAYLGAAFTPWPLGAEVRALLDASNDDWPAAITESFTTWRRELLAADGEKIPSLAGLLDRLSLVAEGDALRASIHVDRALGDEIGSVMSEGMQVAFGGLGGLAMEAGSVSEESILKESELERFVPNLDAERLPRVDPKENLFAGPELQSLTGPFAVRIAARRVQSDGTLELEIAADSSRIPNLQQDTHHQGDTPLLSLTVTSVQHASGRELLAEETCGRGRNEVPTALRAGSDMEYDGNDFVKVAPTWSGEKKVRLAEGVTLDDVQSVEGQLFLRLPTRVETVRVAPFSGEVVERDGVRIAFQPIEGDETDRVAYELSGDFERILAVRAQNAAGKYLQTASGSSSTHAMRPGKSVSQSFHGKVGGVELVFATEIEERSYPFHLEGAKPRFDSWTHEQQPAKPQARSAFRREISRISLAEACPPDLPTVDASPFRLCVGEPQPSWGGVSAPIQLVAPKARAFESNLSGIEIALDRVAIRDAHGVTHVLDTQASEFATPTARWQSPLLEEDLWLRATFEEEAPSGDVVGLSGRVVHRLPTLLDSLPIDLSRLGNEIEYTNGFGMRFVEVAAGRLHFDFRGDRAPIVQLVVRDENGEILPTRNVQFQVVDDRERTMMARMMGGVVSAGEEQEEKDPRPLHRASLEVAAPDGSTPARLEVVYAREIDEKTVPFQARLEETPGELAATP